MTEGYKRGVRLDRANALEDKAAMTNKLSVKVLDQLAAMEKGVAKRDDELGSVNKRLMIVGSKVAPRYIISEKDQAWHVCQQWQERPAKGWKTVCG